MINGMKIPTAIPWQDKLTQVQTSAVAAILARLDSQKTALLQMPTGTGKTEVAFNVIKEHLAKSNLPILWLTHRTNLKEQTRERGTKFFKDFTVSEFHGKVRHFNSNIIVGMVPSLARDKGYRQLTKHINRHGFSLVVVDEAHHVPAKQFVRVLKTILKNKIPLLGLTATPRRPDGMPLCFGDEPAFVYGFAEAATDNTVATPHVKLTLTNTVINGVPTKNGDYFAIRKLLDRKIVINQRNRIIIDKVKKDAQAFWKKYGLKAKYIVYCINIVHAQRMNALFCAEKFSSAVYVGDEKILSKDDRKLVFEKFKNNELEMLCVVDLMNEGVDIPDINTLVMCRPTYSNIVYAQQLGRGTRAGKPHVLVFDFFDNYTHAYGARTAANTDAISVPKGNIEIDKTYVDERDFIAVEKQVNQAFENIDAYQRGLRNFYLTKAEAYAACRRLGITSYNEHVKKYKQDPKLPADPHRYYKNWSFLYLSGRTWKNYDLCYKTIKEAYAACQKLNIKTHSDYKKRHKKDLKLPTDPKRCYKNWSFCALTNKLPPKVSGQLLRNRLLRLAKNPLTKKPKNGSKLSRALIRYTNKKQSGFNKKFSDVLRRLRPDWFDRSINRNKNIIDRLPSNLTFCKGQKLTSMAKKYWFVTDRGDKIYRQLTSLLVRAKTRPIYQRKIFYPTIAEAYAACRILGITSVREYNRLHKKDPKLPATPSYVYKNWSFTVLNKK